MIETLVLVPGLMCDDAVWEHQVGLLGAGRDVRVASHGMIDSLGMMAERILDHAPRRFALAGHSMGGRVALEVAARAPERVTRLALLDTGYEALAPGEPGERERAGRYRLLEMARREGMLPMAQDWARGMVHPLRLTEAPLMDSIHAMIARANAGAVRCADPRAARPPRPHRAARAAAPAGAGAVRTRRCVEPAGTP